MSTSRLWQKILASFVNCTLVLLVSAPFYPLLGANLWKIATIAIFFLYNICCRKRCLGMRLVGTFIEPPTSILYAALYTCGFATFFYSVWFPTDLLLANGVAQVGSLAMTGNTLHANLAGQGTINRDDYVKCCKSRARLSMLIDDPTKAVHELIADLAKYPDTKLPSYIADMGLVLLKERDEYWINRWIDGVQ